MGARSSQSRGPGLNKSDGHLLEYFRHTFGAGGGGTNYSPPAGLTATGGIISDYTDPSPGKIYRAHVFTGSGTFNVTALANGFPNNVEYLVVAGGGGGGGDSSGTGRGCGGGGAGGFRTNVPGHPLAGSAFPVSATSYTVTIGGGGIQDLAGSNSVFGSITSAGGGRGSRYPGSEAGGNGGSGGGGHGDTPNAGGSGNTPPSSPPQGNGGGSGANTGGGGGGGGGGAGAAGSNASGTAGGNGGAGSPIAIETTTAKTYAGGGAGAGGSGASATGGAGGGGNSGPPNSGSVTPGTANTGGGGGGASGPGGDGGAGGSGIVVVRYQIGEITAQAKASGGVVSFYGGKTIHTFTGSGTFANPTALNGGASNPLTVEMIVIGGGGGGGYDRAGGGGAGSYVHATNMAIASGSSHPVVVGSGGIGGRASISGQSGDSAGLQGTPSTYNSSTIIALGGGGGGATSGTPNAGAAGGSGGSGGGSAAHGPRVPGPAVAPPTSPATAATTDPGGKSFQNDGGQGAPTSSYPFVAAGGGGAGGAGGDGSTSGGPPYPGVAGGVGKQLPSTFQNPASSLGYPGPSGNYWVAGGGGSGATDNGTGGPGGGHPAATSSYAGGGIGGESPVTFGAPEAPLRNGRDNSGGGGGGGGNNPNNAALADGAFGGSGLVLIAYPT